VITRPALRYFGGKWRLAPWIISHFPPHRVYCEAFGGGASVLLRKPRSFAEVYNDLDGEIVNFFAVLRDPRQAERLRQLVERTPFARAEFELAHEPSPDPVEQARRTICRSLMGHGADSLTGQYRTGFRAKSNTQNRCAALDWLNYPPQIPLFAERMQGVVIENKDALSVLYDQDSPDTLHFVDPPYVHSERHPSHGYRHELSNDEHVELLGCLSGLRGMVLLSCYENEIYEYLHVLRWRKVRCKALADGAQERTEILWINPRAAEAQSQLSLLAAEERGGA
jgi:DNA adenine methylase